MSKKTIEKFYSDLSDAEIKSDYSPLSFSFDGTAYEIDLTEQEKAAFANELQKYTEVARQVSRRTSPPRTNSASKYDPKAVRAWASENKVEVPARGRIPAGVIEAYQQANR